MTDNPLGTARVASHDPSVFSGLLAPIEETAAPAALRPASAPALEASPAPEALAATPVVEAAKEQPKAPTEPAKPRRAREPKTAAPTEAATAVTHTEDAGEGKDLANQPVQISLPISLGEKLEAYKKDSGLSHPFILFEAIEESIEELPRLVLAKTVQVSTETRTLFNRPASVAKRQLDVEPRKTFIIRITQENKGILDQLWKDVGAPSRNVMIVAAYEAFLATKAKKPTQ